MIRDLNESVNLIALVIIAMGVILAASNPNATDVLSIANTLVSAGVGAITGVAAVRKLQQTDDSKRQELPKQP